MSSLFERCLLLGEDINYPILLEAEDGQWCWCGDEVYWVDSNGDVYNGDTREGSDQQEGCSFVNIDNGSGMTITKVFKTDSLISYDEFEELYEDKF